MVHILGGALTGASFSPIRERDHRPGQPDNLGHFFMALDQRAFRDEGEFEADLDDVIDILHETPPADPAKPEPAAVAAALDLVAIDRELLGKLGARSAERGTTFGWEGRVAQLHEVYARLGGGAR